MAFVSSVDDDWGSVRVIDVLVVSIALLVTVLVQVIFVKSNGSVSFVSKGELLVVTSPSLTNNSVVFISIVWLVPSLSIVRSSDDSVMVSVIIISGIWLVAVSSLLAKNSVVVVVGSVTVTVDVGSVETRLVLPMSFVTVDWVKSSKFSDDNVVSFGLTDVRPSITIGVVIDDRSSFNTVVVVDDSFIILGVDISTISTGVVIWVWAVVD